MKYNQRIELKDGREALLRHGTAADGAAVFENFNQTHAATDYRLYYPDENSFTAEQEGRFLERKAESAHEGEIIAILDGRVVGTAGIDAIGTKYKVRHRAEFGISVSRDYWGLGVGRALMDACIECARQAGYTQLELTAVAENERALEMYRKAGFVEFGRNPRGFNSRISGYQEIVCMRMELAD